METTPRISLKQILKFAGSKPTSGERARALKRGKKLQQEELGRQDKGDQKQ